MSRRGKIAVIIGIAATSLLIIELVNSTFTCPPQMILNSYTTIIIPGQHHADYGFNTNHHQFIQGHFTANISTALFILNQTAFHQFNVTGDGIQYSWTSSYTTDGWLCGGSGNSCPDPPPVTPIGTGYIVFYNPNTSTASVNTGVLGVLIERCYPIPFT